MTIEQAMRKAEMLIENYPHDKTNEMKARYCRKGIEKTQALMHRRIELSRTIGHDLDRATLFQAMEDKVMEANEFFHEEISRMLRRMYR